MKRVALIGVLMVIALFTVAAIPAGAANPWGVLAFSGTATLNGTPRPFPCTGATCLGTFKGKGNGRGILIPGNKQWTCVNCLITASYKYSEPGGACVANTPVAPTGTANGTITTFAKPSQFTSKFAWTRVGVTAVVTLSNPLGAAVAGFVPPHTCKVKTATVAGVAVVA